MIPIRYALALAVAALSWGCSQDDQDCPPPIPSFPPRDAPAPIPPSEFKRDLAPLSTLPVPEPVGDIVDRSAAIRLGKAFFWDIQAGSDGQTACATCHFSAGADRRIRNTLNPGQNGSFDASGVTGPGQTWNGRSLSSDDSVGSQGVVRSVFKNLNPDLSSAADVCEPAPAPPFEAERQVTPRNSPSVIGAVFNRENFWDGRASDEFNGLDPFGRYSLRYEGEGCEMRQLEVGVVTKDSSLASQAMGPPENDAEMICAGRPVDGPKGLGKKLLDRHPLALQEVSTEDSVLGALAATPPSRGLSCAGTPCTYRALVAQAFGDKMAADAENRFGRIWGQALQAYQSTLIPDRTPLDRFLEGDTTALSAQQQLGLTTFQGRAGCIRCHAGPTLSDASAWFAQKNGLVNEDGGDQGYHNIGVRPPEEDLGRGAEGPNGLPFALTDSPKNRGAFKTPSLRNVGLTAPYFHNGGKATLLDVLTFYIRGGDVHGAELATGIQALNLSTAEHNALLEFLQNGLTDCRVATLQAPFDHPSLPVPHGPLLPAVGRLGTGPCPP